MITIITIGRKHEDWVAAGVERYEKRLRRPFDLEWVLLPHSSLDGLRARQEESERIISRIPIGAYVLLLDETGVMLDSPALTRVIEDCQLHSRPIVVIIGGAYGVTPALMKQADQVVSLSKLVFPHQLVRLILAEQLYRCQEISRGSGYHHV